MNLLSNQVQLIGRIGNTLELKETKKGLKFLTLSIATNEFYRNANGDKVKETTWHKIIAWSKSAELMHNLLEKGNEIMVKGKLSNRSYDDKNGDKKFITEIVVNSFLKLEKKEKADLPF